MNQVVSQAKELVEQIRNRRLMELRLVKGDEDDTSPSLRVLEFLISLKLDLRLYAISTGTHVEDIWAIIREDEVVTDFIFSMTGELRTALDTGKGINWACLIDSISVGYGRPGRFELSAIDEDTYHRLPTDASLKGVLTSNHWLITLYLLEMVDLPIESEELSPANRRGR